MWWPSSWPASYRVIRVGMESTGCYWKPVWHLLEDQGSAGCSTRPTCTTSLGVMPTTPMRPGLPIWSSRAGQSDTRRHLPRLAGTYRSIRCAQLRPMRPVSGRLAGTPKKPEEPAEPGRCTMPTPPPRHLARPRRPWRLLLFVFGLTTAALAALVASATLLPQPEPPRRAPGVALPTRPTKPAPTSASTTTTAPREPTTTPPPSTTPNVGRRAVSRPTTTTGPATAQAPATVDGTTTVTAPSDLGATTQPTVTAPSTTAASTTTLVTTTSIAPTTGPTTTGPATTTSGPATTTSGLVTT